MRARAPRSALRAPRSALRGPSVDRMGWPAPRRVEGSEAWREAWFARSLQFVVPQPSPSPGPARPSKVLMRGAPTCPSVLERGARRGRRQSGVVLEVLSCSSCGPFVVCASTRAGAELRRGRARAGPGCTARRTVGARAPQPAANPHRTADAAGPSLRLVLGPVTRGSGAPRRLGCQVPSLLICKALPIGTLCKGRSAHARRRRGPCGGPSARPPPVARALTLGCLFLEPHHSFWPIRRGSRPIDRWRGPGVRGAGGRGGALGGWARAPKGPRPRRVWGPAPSALAQTARKHSATS